MRTPYNKHSRRDPSNRDSQQLRKQTPGTLTLYLNFSDIAVEIGLRANNRDTKAPQRPYTLKASTGILVEKRSSNSVLVSLLHGQKSHFWAFECQERDDSEVAPRWSDSPPKERVSGSASEQESEKGVDSGGDEHEEPQRKMVMVKDLPSLHHYKGLRGFINEGKSTGARYRVEFPNSAPAKTFPASQVIELPNNASMRDRLTPSVRVWIHRCLGLPGWAQDYLRAQRGHKALVRCLGYNALYRKFMFTRGSRSLDCIAIQRNAFTIRAPHKHKCCCKPRSAFSAEASARHIHCGMVPVSLP